ncbi:MAG: TIGR02117 family protein [Pirellulaceae bacterium]|jgi:uncharacterized protein (TIGR02117 family)|nr:TIGR02117 family protein [Pirellulaceae bacterium]MDP7016627.1 TIGR02117 family protein [Pirellulaceae bacterium]
MTGKGPSTNTTADDQSSLGRTRHGSRAAAVAERFWRVFIRTLKTLVFLIVCYAALVALGMIPVNNSFQPAVDGVRIYVISSAIHADFVLPIDTPARNWREKFPSESFVGDTSLATHVAIGWGDQGFFIGTPTWDDLRFSTAANALLWPSDSCIHTFMCRPRDLPSARSLRISTEQYERLIEHIDRALAVNAAGQAIQIGDAHYTDQDAFFESNGHYHCFNTCNSWIGGGLKRSGVRTGWFTPLPGTPLAYLPE